MRQFFVLIHRYVGLVMTLFLVVAGFTGIFLAFYTELDDWINRDIVYVQKPSLDVKSTDAKLIDPFTLREMMVKQYPLASFISVELKQSSDKAASFYLNPKINPATKQPYVFENDEVFINPYTGEMLGARKWGDITQGIKNLMPFVYRLHYSLALGTIGSYAFGIIALLWTMDCFVGAYLTFPAKQKTGRKHPHPLSQWERVADRSGEGKAWLHRWWKSWKIRWQGGFYKVNFDLHRAGGLWLWAMLFVFAWSSVGFNLREIYNPVTKTLFETQILLEDRIKQKSAVESPYLDYRTAYKVAKQLAADEATKYDFHILEENSLGYDSTYGTYEYRFKTNLDVSEKRGQTKVYLDGNTGKHVLTYLPTGKASGDTITEWVMQLHMAGLWGLPMQVFVSAMGFVVSALTITGLIIWLKKRKSHKVIKRQKILN